jgi:serine protease
MVRKSLFTRISPAALALGVALAGIFALPAAALDQVTRAVGPVRAWDASALAGYEPSRIYVKFVEGSDCTSREGRFVDASGKPSSSVEAAMGGSVVLGPTFQVERATARAWKAEGERRSGRTGPDLSLWFDVDVPGGAEDLARVLNALNACPEVEIAHPAPLVAPAVLPAGAAASFVEPTGLDGSRTTTPDFTARQEYLGLPPTGLNAGAAWAQAGGTGEGMKFIDVELCWTGDHEDFDYTHCFFIGGAPQNSAYETHGTAVLGEILGQNNGFGINGFSPAVRYGVEAILESEHPNVPHRFQDAVDHLSPGDVWQIELQVISPTVPMEYVQVNYDVIWTSVWGRGILCLEAGANGSNNLDDPSFQGIFDRNVRDSGAIMVAAGGPYDRMASWFTNYGSRMDAHAWGESITTTGYGDLYNGGTLQRRYTATFSGTSGATPMVCGCALCLQGIARAQLGTPLPPETIRSIITDTGVPAPPQPKYIGPRPDLAAAASQLLSLTSVRQSPALLAGPRAWPNPFGASTCIVWSAPAGPAPALRVLDAAGRIVRTLRSNGPIPAGGGSALAVWDGRDGLGRKCASGAYFIVPESGVASSTKIALIH